MANLNLSIAIGDYDRTRPLLDGEVQIDGVEPTYLALSPEEMFFRAFRHMDFDICELSLSSFTVRTAKNDCPYIGIPVFLSRAFRHTSMVIRTDKGITKPEDLKGRRIGMPEYQLTACVWARALLEDEFGVKPSDITWVRGGMDQAGRIEKLKLDLPDDVIIEDAPIDKTLNEMLASGEIDGIIGPRLPSCFEQGDPNVDWIFEDPTKAASEYYQRTQIFPIMHILGIKKTLAEEHPWLPATLYKAFEASKNVALEKLSDTSATKVTLPFIEEQIRQAKKVMGNDFWSYGLSDTNHKVLDTFLSHHHSQGLSSRKVAVEELFHPAGLELFKI